jgi:phosphatidate cytidylyltransferase
MTTGERLFGLQYAFDHPVTTVIVVLVACVIAGSGVTIHLLRRRGFVSGELHQELSRRWGSWVWLSVLLLTPILLGAFWTVLAVCGLSVFCYREYARATGLFREKAVSAVVVLGILAVTFAALDHFDRLFLATAPLTVVLIALCTIPEDRPSGYIQRVGLGSLGFLLFGFSLGYLGNMANDPDYRPILATILLAVASSDVCAYCTGKILGRRKILPNTSPNKTVAGCVGALLLTTALVAGAGHFIFRGEPMDSVDRLLLLGLLVGFLAQAGDFMLSSLKRDLGLKDIGATIPGHGGLLDRFDSLVLVPPAVYHYLSIIQGPMGAESAARILTGG